MGSCLHAELIASTGLFFTLDGAGLLVDALNTPFRSFQGTPRETAERIVAGAPPYDRVCGLVYSHLHPDHYSQADNAAFLRAHPDVPAFFPTRETPDHGVLTMGPFRVEYRYLEHTPCDYAWAKHYVLLVSAGGTAVYLTTDAALDTAAHLDFLAGRRADYGFWNAMYLSHPETRALMRRAAAGNYIYHMPASADDAICRKAARNFERYPEELAGVTVLDRYPASLELPPMCAKLF